MGTKQSCKCYKCRGACGNKPGWFKSGEAEKVAEFLGLSLPELFRTKLAVDWWEADEDSGDKTVFLLSPAVTTSPAGEEFPGNPNGRCVFFKNDLCEIHEVKPFECREALPCNGGDNPNPHKAAMKTWNNDAAQEQVRELLGREPEASGYSIFDLIASWR